jgi:serine/threonine-protein kinase ATR
MALAVQSSTKETRNKKENTVGRFLQNYILGLMARLTDVINDSVASAQPIMEQRRYIRALEEMIRLGKGYVRIARPQISACLLSALAQDDLREAAFSCWASMLTYLEEEDVEALLETTFFIVGRYWASLNPATSEVVHGMLKHLLERHEMALGNCISRLPSLSHIPELEKVNSKLDRLRPALVAEEALEVFAERLGHDNSGVVQQALKELVPYLKENQSALYTSAVSQRPDATITTLLRALLDCACKNAGSHTDIPQLCAECIGLIGCLDSNQIEAVREQRTIVILNNFATSDEMTDFTLFLLEVVLVPSFLSATDTKLQGFLSFAMQELLDRSEIRAACEMQSAGILEGADIYRKWVALPESVREVVTPFLSSHYLVAPMVPAPIEYPLFRPGRLYVNWLRSFAIDLLRKGQTPFADMIFEPLTRVIRVKDVRTAEFLLPYLVLHLLVGARSSEEERNQVMGEILGILQHQAPNDASSLEREDLNRFCQVSSFV